MDGYRRVAVVNGAEYDMENTDETVFLNEGLVPSFPDLRGAAITSQVDNERREVRFYFTKRAGEKG